MAERDAPTPRNSFAASWLALREPYDAAARSAALAESFCRAAMSSQEQAPRLIDLAAGRGANALYLNRHLPADTAWVLVDHDPALLEDAATRLSPMTVECRPIDLHRELQAIDFGAADGVTASAFLDLVSSDWLERFAARCASAAAPILLSMTFDGAMAWQPADSFDADIQAAFATHQRSDKGFGPALGPAAAARAEAALAARGFSVEMRPSPWRLSADDPRILDALVEGIADACRAVAPAAREQIESWHAMRCDQSQSGQLALKVGHVDILALPPEF